MPIEKLLVFLFSIITAIIMVWLVSNEMIKAKKIKIFLPFFVFGFLLNIQSGYYLKNISNSTAWGIINILVSLQFLLILIAVIKKTNE